ncbi:MAG TPA: SCO family protein [Thermoanaerobaculia bacterium]|jgi:protein SCO1/2
MDRRQVLTGLATATAATAVTAVLPAAARGEGRPAQAASDCFMPGEILPNVVLTTHENEKALFFRDLVRGRTLLVHFLSIAGEAASPVAAHLARVQPFLGEALGRDVFLYSITADPERDTPRALADFAARHGARPGWLFLTGERDAIDLLRGRLFLHGADHEHGGSHAADPSTAEDCSLGLARYGNAAAGLWGSVPLRADPAQIAERLAWVRGVGAPAQGTGAAPRRKGPPVLAVRPVTSEAKR